MSLISKLFSKKKVKKKCFIYGVVESFYCYDHKNPHYESTCQRQCEACNLMDGTKQ